MRSKKLTAALAATVASVALMPTSALALGAHGGLKGVKHLGAGGCRLRLGVNPHVANVGDSVLLTGALVCGGGQQGGQTATIFEQIAGVPGGFKVVGTATTAPTGVFTFTPPPMVGDSTFYATALSARSAGRKVRVGPQVAVTPPAPEGSLLQTGIANKVTFTGSVSPSDVGAEVVLQRENGTISEEWGPIQYHNFVQPNGTYTIVHRFLVPGDANLRVVVRPHGHFGVRGVSDVMNYVIAQHQNANLTLEPTPDPVAYGSPVAIKGVTKAGAGAKVTLIGKIFGGGPAPLGETTAGAGGSWTMTIPSAIQSTHYKATSGTFHSADVFEGVHWVVTSNPVPASVSSGTQVTFSGTAAPASRTGHVVYLERRNLTGTGWHIVDLGFTTTGGAFSIPFYVIGSGKQEYRVKIPGDPINQGVAGAAQAIEVTPAPATVAEPIIQPTLPH